MGHKYNIRLLRLAIAHNQIKMNSNSCNIVDDQFHYIFCYHNIIANTTDNIAFDRIYRATFRKDLFLQIGLHQSQSDFLWTIWSTVTRCIAFKWKLNSTKANLARQLWQQAHFGHVASSFLRRDENLIKPRIAVTYFIIATKYPVVHNPRNCRRRSLVTSFTRKKLSPWPPAGKQ